MTQPRRQPIFVSFYIQEFIELLINIIKCSCSDLSFKLLDAMIINNPDILKAHPFSGGTGVKTDVFTYSSSGILRTCYPAGNTSLRLHFIKNYFLPILSAL